MSSFPVRHCRWPWLLLAVALAAASTLRAAVTFTVTPAAVTNTYTGLLTLQASGLAAGDTVLVQEYLDLNTNGVIDAADWLVQQFPLTDGQPGMVLGGVTNLNVPGDLNPTAGAITATLAFQNGNFLPRVAGRFLFRLSSPGGHFAAVTTPFSVTSFPYPQKITGTVLANGAAVPFATALLFNLAPGQTKPQGPMVGAVANSSGAYTLAAPPGTYMVAGFKADYLLSLAGAPALTLGAGATLNNNPNLVPATATLSGQVVDAANRSLGVGGVLVSARSASGTMGVGVTDPNGNFSLGVQAGQWEVGVDDTTLAVQGYMGWQNRTNVNAGATGLILPLPKATALIYGTVQDNLGQPLAGIDVYVSDGPGSSLYEMDGYTDPNGHYAVGVVGGSDAWSAEVSTDNQPGNYLFTSSTVLTLSNGQATRWDFTAVEASAQITGTLTDEHQAPISGVGIWAGTTLNGVAYQTYTDTDNNGRYTLNVAPGDWSVGVSTCTDCNDGLPGNYLAPAAQTVSVTTNNPVLSFVALSAAQRISGRLQDSSGRPLTNVGLYATATIAGLTYSASTGTDTSGNYSLNVGNGLWTVGVMCGGGGPYTSLDALFGNGNYQCPSTQTVSINNNGGTADFTVSQGGPAVQIASGTLPLAVAGVPYSQGLQAAGGQPPYSWALAPASPNLPATLTLAGNGTLFGTPLTAGTFTFSVLVTDSLSHSATAWLELTVEPPGSVVVGLQSDSATLAAALGPGMPSAAQLSQLDAGNDAGLAYIPALSGGFGSYTPLPSNAPQGTEVINLPPGDGESGFFKVTFTLPPGFQNVSLSGAANVDDLGRAFLNGSPISPSLSGSGTISEGGNTGFGTTNAALFRVGTNELVVADANTGGGPSAAAFYANVVYGLGTTKAPPRLAGPLHLANGQLSFQLTEALVGANYTLQMTPSLNPPVWTTLFTTNAPSPAFALTDLTATNLTRFYRVVAGP